MRKARFTEHQIIAVLKSVEAGRTVKDVCREAGISEASYYNWCVFRSVRSWIGIEVRSLFRIHSINREALTFSTAF